MQEKTHEPRKPYVGRWMPRLEDFRLVTGQGRYTDDTSFPDQAYGYFVRSPHAMPVSGPLIPQLRRRWRA
jgi:hypothetical protein